jgi:hypothetical protein
VREYRNTIGIHGDSISKQYGTGNWHEFKQQS